jgi:hypothetical protein
VTSISRNVETKDDLIDWWDDQELDDTVDVSVNPGEVVLFVREGEVVAQLAPGRHRITAESHPDLEDWLDGDDDEMAIAFMTVGRSIEVEASIGYTWGEKDEAFVTGTAKLIVTDGSRAIGLLEHLDDEESLEDWLGDEVATHIADAILEIKVESIVDITSQAHDEDIGIAALAKVNDVLKNYGVKVESISELLKHQLDPETEERIKADFKKKAYAKL